MTTTNRPPRPSWLTSALLERDWYSIHVSHPWDSENANPERDIEEARRYIHAHTGRDAEHLLMAPPEMSAMLRSEPVMRHMRLMPLEPAGVITQMNGIKIHVESRVIRAPHLKRTLYVMGGTALLVNCYPDNWAYKHQAQPCMAVVLTGLAAPKRLAVGLPSR